jgi:hydrogenase maturation protease
MNTKPIDAIATAVLYEGYMLYPYRPSSVKNRQRFNFGVLYPRAYSHAQTGSDAWSTQTEFLVEGTSLTSIDVRARFLKLAFRSERKLADQAPKLEVNGSFAAPWQEAIECDVAVPTCNLDALAAAGLDWQFAFAAKDETESSHDASGQQVEITRKQESVCGVLKVNATRARDGLFKIQVRLENLTSSAEEDSARQSRDQVLMRSLVSAHILLGVADGQFVSLLEPPENLKDLAAGCRNVGVWPVLVGAAGERDTMLASPIILYDYPQIAPESPGDLFDGAEIDEILALRIMTMTDDEKHEMRHGDERARKILERTEALPMEHLMKLHGTLRDLHSLNEEMP